MERCNLLEKERGRVEKDEMCAWRTRFVHRMEKRKKGPVEPEKEAEEDKLECFFSSIYEFHNPAPVFVPPISVPAALPPRYAINFVRAASVPVTSPIVVISPIVAPVTSPLTDYSVISSVNFALPVSPISSLSCIGQTK